MSNLQFTTLRRAERGERAVPLLRVSDLTVKVGIRRVLENLDLDIYEGDTVCISGPNGSGKSTLLNAIAGLDPARIENGTISLGGEDVTALPPHERSLRGLASMRQRDNVFPDLTVGENLRLAIGRDGAATFHEAFPSWAADIPARKRAGLLSGGQKQRLAWAMATLRSSRVLLADEPEAGLSSRLPAPATPTFLFVGHAGLAVARYCEEAIDHWRQGLLPTDEDAWAMAGLPYIDELRKLVQDDDRPWLQSMLSAPRPSLRRLAVNVARPIANDQLQQAVSRLWKQEPHLNTKLSMLFFLAHSALLDWTEVLGFLSGRREEVVPLVLSYYQNHPRGAAAAIAERLGDPACASSRVLYLFTLREVARGGDRVPSGLGPQLAQLEAGADELLAALARDVRVALDGRREPKS